MKGHITVRGDNGEFAAYIVRPNTPPAPAVIVLHEVFGVNADIQQPATNWPKRVSLRSRLTCIWRQEPGVDLSVTSEPDWQHGLRLYQAYRPRRRCQGR